MYKLILMLIIFLLIMYMICGILYDSYKIMYYDYFNPYIPNNYAYYPYYPFWNLSTRHTRNMSYDLRGDVPIPYFMNLPFNMPENMPIENRTLSDIS